MVKDLVREGLVGKEITDPPNERDVVTGKYPERWKSLELETDNGTWLE